MEVLRNGRFMFTIDTRELQRGLRPSSRAPRDNKYLVEAVSAVGLDGVLHVVADMEPSRVDTTIDIADGFPYPQVFVLNNIILFCGISRIYELEGGVLTLRITVDPGVRWSAVDFGDFIYMSNGVESVIRSAESKLWSSVTNLPIATALCDFNGQVMAGGTS